MKLECAMHKSVAKARNERLQIELQAERRELEERRAAERIKRLPPRDEARRQLLLAMEKHE